MSAQFFDLLADVRRARVGGPSKKAVLMVLAEHAGLDANGEWSCYPSQETIAEVVELSVRQVRAILADFEERGLIRRLSRVAGRGRGAGRTSDLITLVSAAITALMPAIMAIEQPEETAGRSHEQPEDVAGKSIDLPEAQRATYRKPTSGELPEEQQQDLGVDVVDPKVDRSTRGTALADGFPPEQLRSWAHAGDPQLDVGLEAAQFRDYHRSKGTRSKDWPASWRTWVRNAARFAGRRFLTPADGPLFAGDALDGATPFGSSPATDRAGAQWRFMPPAVVREVDREQLVAHGVAYLDANPLITDPQLAAEMQAFGESQLLEETG